MRCRQRRSVALRGLLCVLVLLLTPTSLRASEKNCLWSVTSDQNTVYLLGSVHILKQDNYPLNARIYQAFDRASHLVFEVNLDEMSSPLTQISSLRKGMFTDGQTLKSALSPESYALAKTKLATHGYQIKLFNLMKPWMLATTITVLELQKLGFETDQGVDHHFFEKGKTAGKTIEGLETVEYQLNRFDTLSSKTQEHFLLQTLGELDILEQQTHRLIDSWTHGHIEGLENILQNMREFPEVYHALITQRNNNWLPHVESYLQQSEPYMIVVGTLHLLGEKGLLEMLKKKGYVIKQL